MTVNVRSVLGDQTMSAAAQDYVAAWDDRNWVDGYDSTDTEEDDCMDVGEDESLDESADEVMELATEPAVPFANDPYNLQKIQEITDSTTINVVHPLREGKRLLVLDVDQTIVDARALRKGELSPRQCARPGLLEFLREVYKYYDICIWSQRPWNMLVTKLAELEVLEGSSDDWAISFGNAARLMGPVP